jgi:cytochrome P450
MTLHYDPEHWGEVDPNVFYPLRFSSEYDRNKAAFMPFGYGPMSCVGKKTFNTILMKIIFLCN